MRQHGYRLAVASLIAHFSKTEGFMFRTKLISAMFLAATGTLLTVTAFADYGGGGRGRFDRDSYRVQLRGSEEVPVIITRASGEFRLVINEAAGTMTYQMSYNDLEGNVTQAHIHIGQANVAGGVSVWLCQTAASPAPAAVAALVPDCGGPNSGMFSGTLTKDNVTGPAGQGVSAGELDDVISAIRAGKAYGNIHSTLAPGGEIRGQLVH
jgi:hypothetical protein